MLTLDLSHPDNQSLQTQWFTWVLRPDHSRVAVRIMTIINSGSCCCCVSCKKLKSWFLWALRQVFRQSSQSMRLHAGIPSVSFTSWMPSLSWLLGGHFQVWMWLLFTLKTEEWREQSFMLFADSPVSSNRPAALQSCQSFPSSPAAFARSGSTAIWTSAEQSQNLAQKQEFKSWVQILFPSSLWNLS